MKLKRKPMEAKYESQIEAMYQRSAGVLVADGAVTSGWGRR